ncbi:hypothetical protein BaRGS_00027288 [Batillaria attramentaria]|uniref:C1q domain-containing protein n=1 Tax=Batillaria attramentaria TaxID=370345 RepID=A0ABD0K2W0_9CAEN
MQGRMTAMENKHQQDITSMEQRHQQELVALSRDNQHLRQLLEDNLSNLTSQQNCAPKSRVSFHALLTPREYHVNETLAPSHIYLNDGNAFDASTGVFTAPLNGTYIFIANIATSLLSNRTMELAVYMYVDNTVVNVCYSNHPDYTIQGSCQAVVRLSVGQRVWLKNSYAESWYVDSYFSGALLHADLS